MTDSLLINNLIQVIGDIGGDSSPVPQCLGAIFHLDEGYSFGAPMPIIDITAELVTDGERPFGYRSSNRTFQLPVNITAPDRTTMVAAREFLLETVDAQQWTLTWTRDSGPTMVFDCFRALPSDITYELNAERACTCSLVLNFAALPFGHADVKTILNFASPISGTVAPPNPIELDAMATLSSADIAAGWQVSSASAVGGNSATFPAQSYYTGGYYYWGSPAVTDVPAPVKSNTFAAQNLTGQQSLVFWAGFADSAGYQRSWGYYPSPITFAVTLFDSHGHQLALSTTVDAQQSGNLSYPTWGQVVVTIPTNLGSFDITSVTGYSISMFNYSDGNLWYTNPYLQALYAVPSTTSAPASVRGTLVVLNGIAGTAHAPLNLQISQPPGVTVNNVTLTAGQSFIAPAGVTNLTSVKCTGFGTGGAVVTTPNVTVTPGIKYTPTIPTALGTPTTFKGDTQTVTAAAGTSGSSAASVAIQYTGVLPTFKTCVLHRPGLNGSPTLVPYLPITTLNTPVNVASQVSGLNARFGSTYSMMAVFQSFNSPSTARTLTITVYEWEYAGAATYSSSQSVSQLVTPSTQAQNNIVTLGELTLPNKAVPSDNTQVYYTASLNSSNGSDIPLDILMLDTMGQTVVINEASPYSQYWIDEPPPAYDIGGIYGSAYGRNACISVMDSVIVSGGPLTAEPGNNILMAYCVEGAPALQALYASRWRIDRQN